MTPLPPRPEYMLTTYDNPYDPFTEWDDWYRWDRSAGYNTTGLLARVSAVSHDTSELDQYIAVQDGIDEIVKHNVSGMHMKVLRGTLKAV